MVEVLCRKDLSEFNNGMYVDGCVLMQSMQVLPTKNGGQYISGNFQAKGQVAYKVWSNDTAFGKLSTHKDEYIGNICRIRGKIDNYGGILSVIISDLDVVDLSESSINKSDFMEDVYDVLQWNDTLFKVLRKYCSEEVVALFENIIAPYKEKFLCEFAAVSHHDNCKGGLLAHTTKVVRLATLIKMYPEIMNRVSPDLLFIACALHDIGKIMEYDNGAMSEEGLSLSHHTFGVLILSENKSEIVEKKGIEFYNQLLAVVEQHHGEYGERPRTVASYVVFLLDNLESKLTSLNSVLSDSNGNMVVYDGYKLV